MTVDSTGIVFAYMKSLAELLQGLVDKSMYMGLGPADGDLYMQLCDTIKAHIKLLERNIRATDGQCGIDPSGNEKNNSGHESNGAFDPE